MLEKIREALKALKEFSSFLLNKITSFFSGWFTNNDSRSASAASTSPVGTDKSDSLTTSDQTANPALAQESTSLTFPNAITLPEALDVDLTIDTDAASSPNPVSEQKKSSSRSASPSSRP